MFLAIGWSSVATGGGGGGGTRELMESEQGVGNSGVGTTTRGVGGNRGGQNGGVVNLQEPAFTK